MSNETPAVAGYAQIPTGKERCPVSGLKGGMIRLRLPHWKKHPRHPVRIVDLREPGAKRGITLYNKEDLLALLDYEAERQMSRKAQ